MLRNVLYKIFAIGLITLVSVPPCSASWLSDITGIDINIPAGSVNFGPPRPDRIPMMLQNLPKDAAQFFLSPFGGALAFAIRQNRESVRQHCGPAPPEVITALTPFLPPEVFQGVCWAVVAPGFTLSSFAIQDGAAAVTLEDTIVFRDQASGFDPRLWAHELIHVLQYRRLGVEAFAAVYSASWKSLEDEAYNFQGFVSSRLNPGQGNPMWQNQYYQTRADWNGSISSQEYVQAARVSINPQSCSYMRKANNAIQVFNNCPIAFRVVEYQLQNLQTGQIVRSPCESEACVIQPGLYSASWEVPGFVTVGATAMW